MKKEKLLKCLASMLLFMVPVMASTEGSAVTEDMICVRNSSANTHVFAVDAPGTQRRVTELAPGERLCVSGVPLDTTGFVSVYEHAEALEGCSRLVAVGRMEEMLRYVDFDRCFWSSNS